MIQTVQSYIKREKLLQPGNKVILGLSGGMDSMVLLDVLTRLGYRCVAAHCNFHLRGSESDRDAHFVKEWCEQGNIPLVTVDFDTIHHAEKQKISIEMAARELRYEWFETVRQEQGADAIAVAHHRDDSVETILLNLIRGTGIKGMTGIVPKNQRVVRPLLCVSRADVEAYMAEQLLPYVTDSTNKEDLYVRNMIRLKIIPQLEAINPKVKEAIHRTSRNLAEVEKIYNQSMQEISGKVFHNHRIDIARLQETASPQAILFELLSPLGFTPSDIQDIHGSMDGESGRVFCAGPYRLIKDRGFFILDEPDDVSNDQQTYRIGEGTNEIRFPVNLSLHVVNAPVSLRKAPQLLYMDADKVVYPLTLRRWQTGDWFIPFGMKGRKKLSDYFTDKKFSLKEKEEAWVLLSGDRIAWVVGERSDDRFRVTEKTKRVLVVEYKA